MASEPPISWLTLEKGTQVVSADGKDIGKVTDVIADAQKDIFSGLTITSGLFESDRFVPADMIDNMTAEAVTLSIAQDQSERLEPYEA